MGASPCLVVCLECISFLQNKKNFKKNYNKQACLCFFVLLISIPNRDGGYGNWFCGFGLLSRGRIKCSVFALKTSYNLPPLPPFLPKQRECSGNKWFARRMNKLCRDGKSRASNLLAGGSRVSKNRSMCVFVFVEENKGSKKKKGSENYKVWKKKEKASSQWCVRKGP